MVLYQIPWLDLSASPNGVVACLMVASRGSEIAALALVRDVNYVIYHRVTEGEVSRIDDLTESDALASITVLRDAMVLAGFTVEDYAGESVILGIRRLQSLIDAPDTAGSTK